MYDFILTTLDEQVFEIRLNRTDKRNALSKPMLEEIGQAMDEAEKAFNNGEARVMLITAEGRAFSSGIDIAGMNDYIERFGEHWRENLFGTTELLQHIFNKIERSSLPSICVMHGYCMGSGLELALACDMRVVAKRTRLSLPETKLGIIPDVGGTVRLTKLVGPARAKEIIMRGSTIDLDNAEAWGLVNYVVPKDELDEKVQELVDDLKSSAPLAVSYAKRVINDITDNQRGLNIEAWAQAQLFRTEDFERGVEAMLTKNYPVEWSGK